MTTTEERLEATESALAHQEKLVEELNGVVAEQWTAIDRLKKEVEHLRERMGQMEYELRRPSQADAPPPHY